MIEDKTATGGGEWLIDDRRPLDSAGIEQLDQELPGTAETLRGGSYTPTLAVTLHDVVIHG